MESLSVLATACSPSAWSPSVSLLPTPALLLPTLLPPHLASAQGRVGGDLDSIRLAKGSELCLRQQRVHLHLRTSAWSNRSRSSQRGGEKGKSDEARHQEEGPLPGELTGFTMACIQLTWFTIGATWQCGSMCCRCATVKLLTPMARHFPEPPAGAPPASAAGPWGTLSSCSVRGQITTPASVYLSFLCKPNRPPVGDHPPPAALCQRSPWA